MQSTFRRDVSNNVKITQFLDKFFYPYLQRNPLKFPFISFLNYQRSNEYTADYHGIDVLVNNLDATIFIDEKATMDYIDKETPLSTFAFELGYLKNGQFRVGWLIDSTKHTNYYVLIWPHIFHPQNQMIDVAEVMIVKREDVISIVKQSLSLTIDNLHQLAFDIVVNNHHSHHHFMYQKNRYIKPINENIKLIHTLHKAETPLNIVINKYELIKKAQYIFWVTSHNCNNRENVLRITNYRKPKSFQAILDFMKQS